MLLLISSLQAYGQLDTMIVHYENGQLKKLVPKLDGKPNGKFTMWFDNGQISSKGTYKKGKLIKSVSYNQEGGKTNFKRNKPGKSILKQWYANGQLLSTSNAKFRRSFEKQFDSTGMLLSKTLEKKGSAITCLEFTPEETSEVISIKDRSCVCSYGNVIWRQGIFLDEKGRDISTNYSYKKIDYYLTGNRKMETIWNNEINKHIVVEWDENGILIQKNKSL
jgi:antitoxin component YwqK of YwqJK toxin-antitoxin module